MKLSLYEGDSIKVSSGHTHLVVGTVITIMDTLMDRPAFVVMTPDETRKLIKKLKKGLKKELKKLEGRER